MQPPSLQINNVKWAYHERVVFSKISFELPAGKWIALLGPSGIGKSTLLKMIAGLMDLASDDQRVVADNEKPVPQQIAYMAQSDLLLPWANVLENTLLSIKMQHYSLSDRKEKLALAKGLLERVGLRDHFKTYPQALSGGMRQRVALVRTLLTEKPIILMDEPFSSLDAISRYQLQEIAADILNTKTVFFITHDPLEALRLANIIYIMKGKPAHMKAIATLSSPIPRALTHPEIMALQATLYHELSLAADES